MKQLEHNEQVNLMKWWALACHSYGLPEQVLFAIPNGGERNIIVASRMKAEGVRAGIPDLFLSVPKEPSHGLFIEMKKKGGRLSDKQKEVISILDSHGYANIVCYGWIAAKDAIETYLKGDWNV